MLKTSEGFYQTTVAGRTLTSVEPLESYKPQLVADMAPLFVFKPDARGTFLFLADLINQHAAQLFPDGGTRVAQEMRVVRALNTPVQVDGVVLSYESGSVPGAKRKMYQKTKKVLARRGTLGDFVRPGARAEARAESRLFAPQTEENAQIFGLLTETMGASPAELRSRTITLARLEAIERRLEALEIGVMLGDVGLAPRTPATGPVASPAEAAAPSTLSSPLAPPAPPVDDFDFYQAATLAELRHNYRKLCGSLRSGVGPMGAMDAPRDVALAGLELAVPAFLRRHMGPEGAEPATPKDFSIGGRLDAVYADLRALHARFPFTWDENPDTRS